MPQGKAKMARRIAKATEKKLGTRKIVRLVNDDTINANDLNINTPYYLHTDKTITLAFMNKVEGRRLYRFCNSSGKRYLIHEDDLSFYLSTVPLMATAKGWLRKSDDLFLEEIFLETNLGVDIFDYD